MSPLPLIPFAEKCEDAASGLHRFRDGLPGSASKIAAIVSEFFAISAVLRRIHGEEGSRNYDSSFYQTRDDLAIAFRTLGLTLQDIFDVFVKVRDRPAHAVWDDLHHRLELEASFSLVARLELYHEFFDVQFRILEGQATINPTPLRRSISSLLEAQERARLLSQPATARQRRSSRPTMHRVDTSVSPSIYSDEWDTEFLDRPRGPAPEPPLQMPMSPTYTAYTSNSSHTLGSSHTSFSGGSYVPAAAASPVIHWSLGIFDGRHPTTIYQPSFRSHEPSVCHGNPEPDALQNLAQDSFQPALRVSFDEGRLSIQFYWRPSDHRARILVSSKDAFGNPLLYCQPLNNLKIIRDRSTLQLCRARREDGQYTLWARLNFYFHERMVLFYLTFTAMKRQDTAGSIHRPLTDNFELETDGGEECHYSGEIKHGGMLHAIRIFRDYGSGVVRLEAAALRGSKRDVAIWTAFITKYTNDRDWAAFEHGVVSLVAFRPPPYVFMTQYEPPRGEYGHYELPFTTDNDALMFTQIWNQICSSYGRLL